MPAGQCHGAGRKPDGMLIVHADFERRIDLPGAGPCRRPVDLDRSRTGFPKLVSLRVYSFRQGVVIDGEAEADEVFIVLMRGEAGIKVAMEGNEAGVFSIAGNGGPRAVYMPPEASYRLTAVTDCDIAYARVEPLGTTLPETRSFAPTGDQLEVVGHATGMDLAFATVRAGAVVGHDKDGRSPERFVHFRAVDEMSAIVAGELVGDWDTIAFDDGESIIMKVEAGAADVLTVSASASRHVASNGATEALWTASRV